MFKLRQLSLIFSVLLILLLIMTACGSPTTASSPTSPPTQPTSTATPQPTQMPTSPQAGVTPTQGAGGVAPTPTQGQGGGVLPTPTPTQGGGVVVPTPTQDTNAPWLITGGSGAVVDSCFTKQMTDCATDLQLALAKRGPDGQTQSPTSGTQPIQWNATSDPAYPTGAGVTPSGTIMPGDNKWISLTVTPPSGSCQITVFTIKTINPPNQMQMYYLCDPLLMISMAGSSIGSDGPLSPELSACQPTGNSLTCTFTLTDTSTFTGEVDLTSSVASYSDMGSKVTPAQTIISPSQPVSLTLSVPCNGTHEGGFEVDALEHGAPAGGASFSWRGSSC